MASNYVPNRDADFDKFFKYITQYVSLKSSGTSPEWGHITQKDRTALNNVYSQWYSAYALTFQPHIKSVGNEKTRQRKVAEKALRLFVNRFLRYEPVADADRTNMGILNHATTRTSQGTVDKRAAFLISPGNIREVKAKIWAWGSESRAKPAGYHGADIAYDVLEAPPSGPQDLRRNAVSTRSNHILRFTEEERGKRAYVSVRWENKRGVRGEWSEIQSTVIP